MTEHKNSCSKVHQMYHGKNASVWADFFGGSSESLWTGCKTRLSYRWMWSGASYFTNHVTGHTTRILGIHASGCQDRIFHVIGYEQWRCDYSHIIRIPGLNSSGCQANLFEILTVRSFTMVDKWGWLVGDVLLYSC